MFSEAEYRDEVCQIQAPANLYLFSDGIYEIEQADGKLWGLEKFIGLLRESHYLPNNHLQELLKKLEAIRTSNHLEDDVSIMQIVFH
jgi:sigma-B regulation protein RsbU (phosphoserine phosphatase)